MAGNIKASGAMWSNALITTATGSTASYYLTVCDNTGDSNRPANGFAIHKAGVGTRLAIDTNGNVGIGTSSPQTPLHVGAKNFSDSRYYSGAIAVENTLPSLVLVDTDGTTWLDHNNVNERSWWYWTGTSWTRSMALTTSGALWIGGALTQNSDERLKEEIRSIPDALKKNHHPARGYIRLER